MPRVKIDYVVSFSSEDPEHPANNLLNREVSKKKWLCGKGESSCSVVLQLAKAVKISAVHIGAYHAALVEVLVARSETSSEQFQVLVPSSVFLSREESRRDGAVERVRSFSAEQLSDARHQRWDRVRLVCSQPHNKHCKYGLSFVHIDESEGSTAPAVPPQLLALDNFSSDEDDFKPGELFAKHLQKITGGTQANTSSNTGAQIRQATSQALKNIPESSTKLMKTPISKPSVKRDNTPTSERNVDRSRDALLYTNDDERPHAKIDHVLQRHQDERERDPDKTTNKHEKKARDKSKEEPKKTPKRSDSPPKNETPQNKPNRNYDKPTTSDQKRDLTKDMRKRRRSDSQEEPGPVSAEPHTLLRGVVLVLSGYENPRRADVRNTALALGARVERDWAPHCTHLICAFPNTPKLRAVRAAGGAGVPAVRADWLEQCARRRRRLPWRWFATEPRRRLQPPHQLDDTPPSDHHSESDTDDEIEKVLQDQKKRRLTESNKTKKQRDDTSVASPAEESRTGTKAHESEDDIATDEEAGEAAAARRLGGALPDFLEGYTVALDAAPAAPLARYVQAYGGLPLEMTAVEGGEVDYVVRGAGGAGARVAGAREVGAAWLARCHAARALLPHSS